MDPHLSSGPPNLAFCTIAKAVGGNSWDEVGHSCGDSWPPTRPCTQSCGCVSIVPWVLPPCSNRVPTPPKPGLPPLATPSKSGSPSAFMLTSLSGTKTLPSPFGP